MFPSRTQRRKRRSGFSLLEMVVILMLAGIIGALTLPKIDVGRYKADSVVTTVRSALQQAQRASLVAQHDVIVSFDVAGGRVRLAWDANNNHRIDSGERVMSTPISGGNKFAKPDMGIHGAVNDAIVGTNVKQLDNMPTVTFHRDGSLSSDLEVYMSTLAAPIRWRAISVVQATGHTDWYRKTTTGNSWVPGVL